jgi:hypothetical protein
MVSGVPLETPGRDHEEMDGGASDEGVAAR